MSWYYTYYLGYRKDKMIYPYGPFDKDGNWKCVLCLSHSFASDMHEDFGKIKEEEISEPIRKKFECTSWNGEKEVNVWTCNLNNLTNGSFIKTGYYLIEDVVSYEKNHDPFDLFYDCLDPITYAAKAANEARFGAPKPKKDAEGYEYCEHSCADYMFYAWPDINSEEYEAFLLKKTAEMLESYPKFYDEIVVLMTQG